jgi:hypothetical protein
MLEIFPELRHSNFIQNLFVSKIAMAPLANRAKFGLCGSKWKLSKAKFHSFWVNEINIAYDLNV